MLAKLKRWARLDLAIALLLGAFIVEVAEFRLWSEFLDFVTGTGLEFVSTAFSTIVGLFG